MMKKSSNQSDFRSNNISKKINEKNKNEKDYIIISDKPFIFTKKKIKKVGDLIGKTDLTKKEEDEFCFEKEDLSEKFFEKYFSLYNQAIDDKQKIPNASKFDSSLLFKTEKKQKNIQKEENNEQESRKTDKKNQQNEIEERNKFTNSIYQKVLEEERLERLKKKKKFKTYISIVYITQCKLESLEGIHTSLQELLPKVKIDIKIPQLYVDNKLDKIYLIQKLNLSKNNISFIHKDITFLPNLKILDLSFNLISDFNNIQELKNIQKLISLNLRGNKICLINGYRQFMIELCPILSQLDTAEITEKELDIVHFKGSRFGEKRKNGHGEIIKYPNPFKSINKNI